eukprot:3325199-Lingulodinium_polyedra.AAC.1
MGVGHRSDAKKVQLEVWQMEVERVGLREVRAPGAEMPAWQEGATAVAQRVGIKEFCRLAK